MCAHYLLQCAHSQQQEKMTKRAFQEINSMLWTVKRRGKRRRDKVSTLQGIVPQWGCHTSRTLSPLMLFMEKCMHCPLACVPFTPSCSADQTDLHFAGDQRGQVKRELQLRIEGLSSFLHTSVFACMLHFSMHNASNPLVLSHRLRRPPFQRGCK